MRWIYNAHTWSPCIIWIVKSWWNSVGTVRKVPSAWDRLSLSRGLKSSLTKIMNSPSSAIGSKWACRKKGRLLMSVVYLSKESVLKCYVHDLYKVFMHTLKIAFWIPLLILPRRLNIIPELCNSPWYSRLIHVPCSCHCLPDIFEVGSAIWVPLMKEWMDKCVMIDFMNLEGVTWYNIPPNFTNIYIFVAHCFSFCSLQTGFLNFKVFYCWMGCIMIMMVTQFWFSHWISIMDVSACCGPALFCASFNTD